MFTQNLSGMRGIVKEAGEEISLSNSSKRRRLRSIRGSKSMMKEKR
jgi:hypothetical protein